WVCKARWTSAGRDRARGAGSPTGELRSRIARMLARFGPLVLEPWLDRVADIGVCGGGAADRARRPPQPPPPPNDASAGFLGIALAPAVDPALAAPLREVAAAAARRVAVQTGYCGPFAIDAFIYRDGSAVRLHPLCEINARYSFGWIAHGLARRLGIQRL